MINARLETAREQPAFKSLVARNRCLVLADGFFEWKPMGRAKQPFHFHLRSQEPFAFAGLFDEWRMPQGQPLETFTILTTAANATVRPVHDRMPVMLVGPQAAEWLERQNVDDTYWRALTQSAPPEWLAVNPVSARVNNPASTGRSAFNPSRWPGRRSSSTGAEA